MFDDDEILKIMGELWENRKQREINHVILKEVTDMQANTGIKTNRKYKDRLFRYIFGAEENKHYLLSLYNAINGSDYDDVDEIEITTLDDVIYMKQKNDISFLINSELNLYEQQSTYNPNIPLRGMLYFSDLCRQYMSGKKQDLYSSRIVKLPTPQYVVFYNGESERPDKIELKLSEAFEIPEKGRGYEWTAYMLNINIGHNRILLEKCRALYEYSSYVKMVREFSKNMSMETAVNEAVNKAIEAGYLDGFFRKHRGEVFNMTLTEFNEAEFIENRREEGREEGRKSILLDLIREGKIDFSYAAEKLGISEKDVQEMLNRE